MTLALFRCEYDGKLLRKADINNGQCLGHRIQLARNGTFFEWLVVTYWKLTGQI